MISSGVTQVYDVNVELQLRPDVTGAALAVAARKRSTFPRCELQRGDGWCLGQWRIHQAWHRSPKFPGIAGAVHNTSTIILLLNGELHGGPVLDSLLEIF